MKDVWKRASMDTQRYCQYCGGRIQKGDRYAAAGWDYGSANRARIWAHKRCAKPDAAPLPRVVLVPADGKGWR